MIARALPFVLLAALSSACVSSVTVSVLQPSLVQVPQDVRVIGVIDRSAPRNVGQTILGALEGAATGETIQADREGAKESLSAAVATLQDSPRFDVVVPNVDRRQADSGIFDKRLEFHTVRQICKQAHCDAMLALEAFDSDSSLNIGGHPIDRSRAYTDVTVQRDTRVLASWRLYDADHDRVLDQARDFNRHRTWDEHGDTLNAALRALPSQTESIRRVGGMMGTDYAMRIAPSWTRVMRYYYGSGSPELKQGKYHVRANDWEGAKGVWSALVSNPDSKVAGRAEFDLALAHEIDGDLQQALVHARKAAVLLHNSQSRQYVSILQGRIAAEARLQEQMAAPPPEPAAQPRPLAVPEQTKPPVHGPPPESAPQPPPPSNGGATMSRPQ